MDMEHIEDEESRKIYYQIIKEANLSLGKVPYIGESLINLNAILCDYGMHYLRPVACNAINDAAKEQRTSFRQ